MESRPLEWEELLVSVGHELPQPVREETVSDGSTIMVGGDPAEVVVRLTGSSLTVSEYSVEGPGPLDAVPAPVKLGTLHWPRLPGVLALRVIAVLVAAARDLRRSTYVTCIVCERLQPPEAMHDDETCRSCAQTHPAQLSDPRSLIPDP